MAHHPRRHPSLLLALVLTTCAVFSATAPEAGLSSQVTIRRDTFGVPHILGETEEAVAYGQGYATAEDHGAELARLYLKARAEEASVFGEKFAEADFMTLQMHVYQGAAEGFSKLPPVMQRMLNAYSAGYNRYLEKHRDAFPEWARPIAGVDVLAHGRRVLILEFATNLRQLDDIGRRTSNRVTADLEHGSNMWAIGREKSSTGRAMLLGNPHLAWAGSQIFHEIHLTVPGKLNVSGTTLIGLPGVVIGFNENLGWSHTVNLHDADDVYELTLDPRDEHRYIYEGQSMPMSKEELRIQVKTGAGSNQRTKTLYWSHYGPVLKWGAGKAYAFKSANIGETRFVEQWYQMDRAHNLAEFRSALDMQALPMFNICYADREGNIFYIFNGRFPDRPQGIDWSGVVPGNTSATEWDHVLPEARLPQLLNPPGGYVQNSNSSPWYTNLHAIIDRHQYPADLTPTFNGLRTQLGLEMLESHPKLSLDDIRALKFNTKLLLAERVKRDLVRIARERADDGYDLSEAARVLEAWDNTASRESRGSTLFQLFWLKYADKNRSPFAVPWNETYPASTPYGLSNDAAVRKALANAVDEVRRKYHRLDVAWGEVHRLRRGSLDVPVGGFTDMFGAFRVVQYREEKDGTFVAAGGDSYVVAVEFTSPPTAWSIVAYSESDDPGSPHHNDQSKLFADQQWKRAWFTEEDIAHNLERSYRP